MNNNNKITVKVKHVKYLRIVRNVQELNIIFVDKNKIIKKKTLNYLFLKT